VLNQKEAENSKTKECLLKQRKLLDEFLEKYFREITFKYQDKLWEAMKYSTLAGGKRLRGLLVLATYEAISKDNTGLSKILRTASGIELIHTMSLIHDDLPCMDNDSLRRGKPTCHVIFGEDIALLAGDALLIEGIYLCLKSGFPEEIIQKNLTLILESIGGRGMTLGQALDLKYSQEKEKKRLNSNKLKEIHTLKTGALLEASVLAGAVCARANSEKIEALKKYAQNLGLAFQIQDDLLDLTASTRSLGKTSGKDLVQNKSTYPSFWGIKKSKTEASFLIQEAKESLIKAKINSTNLLYIADFVISRET